MEANSTLTAIDLLLEDFKADSIAEHFKDIFAIFLRNSEGYDHCAIADEYEIGRRLITILRDREAATK